MRKKTSNNNNTNESFLCHNLIFCFGQLIWLFPRSPIENARSSSSSAPLIFSPTFSDKFNFENVTIGVLVDFVAIERLFPAYAMFGVARVSKMLNGFVFSSLSYRPSSPLSLRLSLRLLRTTSSLSSIFCLCLRSKNLLPINYNQFFNASMNTYLKRKLLFFSILLCAWPQSQFSIWCAHLTRFTPISSECNLFIIFIHI